MATKSFGIKELNLLSSSGTPTLTSSSNLNLTANTVAITGNLTVSGTVNGGSITGGVTVQDEGSALSTSATTLNFVGSGVAASGTGATKTITINTGSGGISLANGANNRVITSNNANDLNGEANLTFNGSNLACSGTINNVLIGIGGNSSSTNNVVFGNITTGSTVGDFNVLIGYQSGHSNAGTFSSNVAIGYRAQIVGSGIRNISLGYYSGKSGNSTISIGQYAGRSTEGQSIENIFIGKNVGTAFTGGKYNIGLGANSLYSLIENDDVQSKHGHIAIGYSSMYNYSTVDYAGNTNENAGQNIAIGGLALSEGKLGGSNIAIGELALAYLNMGSSIASSAGSGNVAIGDEAGRGSYQGAYSASDTWEGSYNTCVGSNAGQHLKDQASNNTIIGQQAATFLTTGSTNTCLGSSAGKGTYYIGTGSNNLCLGTASEPSANNVSNEITLGNANITKFRIPGINVVLKDNGGTPTQGHVLTVDASGEAGFAAASGGGGSLTSDAQRNTVGGTNAGDSFSGTDATDNTFIGYDAGTSYTTGDQSVIIGSKAGVNANGLGNVFIGYYAGYDNQNGERNTLTGWYSGENLTSGSFNTAYGANSLDQCQTGGDNCVFGYTAAKKCSGSYNTVLGRSAGLDMTSANSNVIVGNRAAFSISSASDNVIIGDRAAFSSLSTGSNNTIIGHDASSSSSSVSNEITLGDTNISTLRCNVQTISSLSDARDKTDIVDIPTGLDFLNDLRPVKFKWQTRDGNGKDGSISAGFLAQDLQKTQKESSAEFLNLVMDNNPDRLEAREGQLIPVLVKAIQELSAKNDALEARIKTLEG